MREQNINELRICFLNTFCFIIAVQMWCLATHLPLIIGDLVPEDNAYWDLFLTLLDITSICFSPILSSEQIAYLQVLIEDHHSEFCNIYPDCSIIPKMHFMIHMPSVILQYVLYIYFCNRLFHFDL